MKRRCECEEAILSDMLDLYEDMRTEFGRTVNPQALCSCAGVPHLAEELAERIRILDGIQSRVLSGGVILLGVVRIPVVEMFTGPIAVPVPARYARNFSAN